MVDPQGELLAIPKEYGAPSETLTWGQVRARLEEAMRYWLVTTRADGRPHVVPIDGLWIEDAYWFGGVPTTVWRSNLVADGRACVHLPDPDGATIVEGVCAIVVPDASFVDRLVQGSTQKYGYSVPASAYAGGVWRLQPRKVMAWSSIAVRRHPLPVPSSSGLAMSRWAETWVASVVSGLAEAVVPADVGPMTAYMRHQFPFLGVKAPAQKAVFRAAQAAAGPPAHDDDVVAAVDALWARPQREHRYLACQLACREAGRASPRLVDHAARWITTDPWWDTCDALARSCVGQVVRRHPALRSTMDQWLDGDDLWLTLAAIIHMGEWKDDIDRDWVFAACLAQAGHPDFFVRKAIGWILRDLAWVDPEAVMDFVEGPGAPVLSGLSKREALKNVKNLARSVDPVKRRS